MKEAGSATTNHLVILAIRKFIKGKNVQNLQTQSYTIENIVDNITYIFGASTALKRDLKQKIMSMLMASGEKIMYENSNLHTNFLEIIEERQLISLMVEYCPLP